MKRLRIFSVFLGLSAISVWRAVIFYQHYRADPSEHNKVLTIFCGSVAVLWICAGIWVTRPEKK